VTVDASLVVRELTIRYGELEAVRGVDLVAQPATVTAVLGPNGAGKTSTVEACCGLRRPTSGSVTLLGGSPRDSRIRERIGVMLQSGGLYPTARPLEWLRHLARLYANPADPRTLLEQVGIDPATRTVTRRLSGGQARRVALAAALLPRPAVLFLDEPTAGLDPLARRSLLELLRGVRDSGTCILLTSHQLADIDDLADQVIVVGAGTVTARGSIAELIGADEGITFDGPPGLQTNTLAILLPVGYQVVEARPGRYVVHGRPVPAVMSAVATWCATNGALAGGLRPGLRTLEDLIETAAQEPR
jgi:ABC-2 type transport system ATP-binding protein